MICTITPTKDDGPFGLACPSSPSSLSWISCVALARRKSPPPTSIRSRPENSWPKTAKSGAVRRMIHASDRRSTNRVTIAPRSPSRRADRCCSLGSFPARMEMKITLSMPRTTSRAVSVTRAIQISGLVSQSIETPQSGSTGPGGECYFASEMALRASGFCTDVRSPIFRPRYVSRTRRLRIFALEVFGRSGTNKTCSG